MSNGFHNAGQEHADGSFLTTRWSLVIRAGGGHTEGRRALDELCRIYWYPLYCYARRRGLPRADAEDAVQGFFLRLLEKDLFGKADRDKGRLRAFLLSSLQDYLVDEHRRATAAKRGGHAEFVPLDTTGAEDRYCREPVENETPEKHFERRWALTVLQRTATALGEGWKKNGKSELFATLSPYLFTPLDASGTQRLATERGMTVTNIKVSLHRLRDSYHTLLRSEIAETVATESEIDAELAALRTAVS